jgi:energy-coupling factor transporter ATP-binding protein EcfA2
MFKLTTILKNIADVNFNSNFEEVLKKINKHELFLFLGKTGSGKSTITNYLLGLNAVLIRDPSSMKIVDCYSDISVIYPKDMTEFENAVKKWQNRCDKKSHSLDNILFIYSLSEKVWHAHLYLKATKEEQTVAINKNHKLSAELSEITPKNIKNYNRYQLYNLLNEEMIFNRYVGKRVWLGQKLAETAFNMNSCTKQADIYEVQLQKFIWADCPGSVDTHIDIAIRLNTFLSIQRVVQAAKSIKGIMIVIDWDEAMAGRFQNLTAVGSFFGKFINNLKEIPFLFLINKCMPDEKTVLTPQNASIQIKIKLQEITQAAQEAIAKMTEGSIDYEKIKDYEDCSKILQIMHQDNIIPINLTDDESRLQIFEWAKSIPEQASANSKDVFDFTRDPDRIVLGGLIDKEVPDWLKALEDSLHFNRTIKNNKKLLLSKKQVYQSQEKLQNIKDLIIKQDKIEEAKEKVTSINADISLRWNALTNEIENYNTQKDNLIGKGEKIEAEIKELDVTDEQVLEKVELDKTNDATGFFAFIGLRNIELPVIYKNPLEYKVDKISTTGEGNKTPSLALLNPKPRPPLAKYEGKYTLNAGESVKGSIQFTVPKNKYLPNVQRLTHLRSEKNQYEKELKEKNKQIKHATELRDKVKISPEELSKKFTELGQDLESAKINKDEYDKQIESLAQSLQVSEAGEIKKNVENLEEMLKKDSEKKQTVDSSIKENEANIKLIIKIGSIVGGVDNLTNSTLPLKLIAKYEEYQGVLTKKNIKLEKRKDEAVMQEKFDENKFLEKLLNNPEIKMINFLESKILPFCDKIEINKINGYLMLCRLQSLDYKYVDKESLLSHALQVFSEVINSREKELRYLTTMLVNLMCKIISIKFLDSHIVEPVNIFSRNFKLTDTHKFDLMLSCLFSDQHELLLHLLKNNQFDPNIINRDGYQLFDYLICADLPNDSTHKFMEVLLSVGAKFQLSNRPIQFSGLHKLIENAAKKITYTFTLLMPAKLADDAMLVILLKKIPSEDKQELLLTNCNNVTALQLIMKQSYSEKVNDSRKAILRKFITKKSKLSLPVLGALIETTDLDLLKFMFERCEIEKEVLNGVLFSGHTPLSLAVSLNAIDIVKYLIHHGVDITKKCALQLNKVALLFLGIMPKGPNCLDFNAWYDPAIMAYLLPLFENKPHCLYYFLGDEHHGDNTITFQYSLDKLIQAATSLRRPVIFISKEPGNVNHFICALYDENKLFIFNPLGLSEMEEFYEQLSEIQKKYPDLGIGLSTDQLQNRQFENDNPVSCGPITLAFVISILKDWDQEQLSHFLNSLQKKELKKYNEATYYEVSVAKFLPPSLSTLLENMITSETYKNALLEMRKNQFNLLLEMPLQLAVLNEMPVNHYLQEYCLNSDMYTLFNNFIYENYKLDEIIQRKEYIELQSKLEQKSSFSGMPKVIKDLQHRSEDIFVQPIALNLPQLKWIKHSNSNVPSSILHLALFLDNNIEMFQLLLANNTLMSTVKENSHDILFASVKADHDKVKLLLNKLVNLNVSFKQVHSKQGDPYFHYLALYGSFKNFSYFIDKISLDELKNNLSCSDKHDNIFFHYAASGKILKKRFTAVIRHEKFKNNSLELGKFFWSKNREKKTPLHLNPDVKSGSEQEIKSIAIEVFTGNLLKLIKEKFYKNNLISPQEMKRSVDSKQSILNLFCEYFKKIITDPHTYNFVNALINTILYTSEDINEKIEDLTNKILTRIQEMMNKNDENKENLDSKFKELIITAFQINDINTIQTDESKTIEALTVENKGLREQLNKSIYLTQKFISLVIRDPMLAKKYALNFEPTLKQPNLNPF